MTAVVTNRQTERQLESYCYPRTDMQQAGTDQVVTSLKRKIWETIIQYLDKLSRDKYQLTSIDSLYL